MGPVDYAAIRDAVNQSRSRRAILAWIGLGGLIGSALRNSTHTAAALQEGQEFSANEIPATPVGVQLEWILDQINGGASTLTEEEVIVHFAPVIFAAQSPKEVLFGLNVMADSGPFSFFRFAKPPTDTLALALLGSLGVKVDTLSVAVEASSPYRVTGLLLDPADETPYTFTALESLPIWKSSEASGISTSGHVVGFAQVAGGQQQAVMWHLGQLTILNDLPGSIASAATGVNGAGQIVGWSALDAFNTVAVMWEKGDGPPRNLPSGWNQSRATAINETGQIVGSRQTVKSGPFAVMWDQRQLRLLEAIGQTGMVTVESQEVRPGISNSESLIPWRASAANAINGIGDVVGWSSTSDLVFDRPHASRWASHWINRRTQNLESEPTWEASEATAINDHGQIVGSVRTIDGHSIPVLWKQGEPTRLMTRRSWEGSRPNAINSGGQVAGFAQIEGLMHAVLWGAWGVTELGGLSEVDQSESAAVAINVVGEVAGWTSYGGYRVAGVWSPSSH